MSFTDYRQLISRLRFCRKSTSDGFHWDLTDNSKMHVTKQPWKTWHRSSDGLHMELQMITQSIHAEPAVGSVGEEQ